MGIKPVKLGFPWWSWISPMRHLHDTMLYQWQYITCSIYVYIIFKSIYAYVSPHRVWLSVECVTLHYQFFSNNRSDVIPKSRVKRVPWGGGESIRNLRLTNTHYYIWASQVAPVVKNPPANAGDTGSIPGSGRSLGKGNGNPPQYFCLVNPMDKGA